MSRLQPACVNRSSDLVPGLAEAKAIKPAEAGLFQFGGALSTNSSWWQMGSRLKPTDHGAGSQLRAAHYGDGVADGGDAIMNSEVIREAFKKLFAFE